MAFDRRRRWIYLQFKMSGKKPSSETEGSNIKRNRKGIALDIKHDVLKRVNTLLKHLTLAPQTS